MGDQVTTIESIDRTLYYPSRCIYTGIELTDEIGRPNSRSDEHIIPECIGGRDRHSIPAASRDANNKLGALLDHLLLSTGNVQCAATRLRHLVPKLFTRCQMTHSLVHDTLDGRYRLHFARDRASAREYTLVGYEEPAGSALNGVLPNEVYFSLDDLCRVRGLTDVAEINKQGAVVLTFDVTPLMRSITETTTNVCYAAWFKIAYGFLYLYVGEAIFDPKLEEIRDVFRSFVEGATDAISIPNIKPRHARQPTDPLQFRTAHVARCSMFQDWIEVEVRLFDHLPLVYRFPKIDGKQSGHVEFRFDMRDPSLTSSIKRAAAENPKGTRMYVLFQKKDNGDSHQ